MAWLNRTTVPDAVRRPRMQVIAQPGTAKENMLPWGGVDITMCVQRLQTRKMLNTPAGSFDVTCTYEPPYGWPSNLARILVPGNLIEISLDAGLPETGFEVVMRGWLNAIEESETMDGRGRPMRSITLAGQDCGQFFLRHEMPYYITTQYMWGLQEAGERMKYGMQIEGSCGKVLEDIFLAVFQRVTPILAVTEEGQLLTEPVLHNEEDGAAEDYWMSQTWLQQLWQSHGKFWSIFQQYVDRPWNEAWGDYIPNLAESHFANYHRASPQTGAGGIAAFTMPDIPGVPASVNLGPVLGQGQKFLGSEGGAGYYLIVRRVPFSRGRWEALPETIIFDAEVKLARTRSDDSERVNLVAATPAGQGWDVTADVPGWAADLGNVLGDEDSMRRYGLMSKVETTQYFDQASTPLNPKEQENYVMDKGEMKAVIAKRAEALWRWFSINHLVNTGVIVCAGIPSIRIGEKVRGQAAGVPTAYFVGTDQIRQTFYIEQVVQDYTEGSGYLTHLAVTRGQPTGTFVEAKKDGINIASRDAQKG